MLFDDAGVRIDLRGDHPIAKDYQSKLKELRTYQYPLRFKTRFHNRINPTGEREPFQSTVALFTGYVDLPDGTREKVRYSRTTPQRKKSGALDYTEGSGEVVTHNMVITDKEMDKAYFMMYLCPTVKRKMLVLENKKQEASEALKAGSKMAAVYFYLTDPDSPIFSDEQRIRTIAMSLGVANAESEKVSVEEVKMTLIKHIEKGEAAKDESVNVDAFKKATTMPEFYKKRAQVFRAIDNNVLRFNNAKMCYEVKYGDDFVKLIDVTARDVKHPEDALIRLMDANPNVQEMFLKVVDEEPAVITKEMIEEMGMNDLRTLCNKHDVPHFGKKKELIIGELIDKMGL
jgi:hypothetical protein